MEELDIAYGDHTEQRLDVYAPADAANAPTIVVVHGGSWIQGDKSNTQSLAIAYASQGYVVVSTNYRLSSQVYHAGADAVSDVACALAWTRLYGVAYGADVNKIVLAGFSAGGHLAALVAYNPDPSHLTGCNAGEAPLTVEGFLNLDGPMDLNLIDQLLGDRAIGMRLFLNNPDDPAERAAMSPVNYITAGDPPALLLGAERSPQTIPHNARMAAALRSAGIAVATVILPGLRHEDVPRAISTAGSAQDLVLEFLQRVIPFPDEAASSCLHE